MYRRKKSYRYVETRCLAKYERKGKKKKKDGNSVCSVNEDWKMTKMTSIDEIENDHISKSIGVLLETRGSSRQRRSRLIEAALLHQVITIVAHAAAMLEKPVATE